MPFFKPVRIRRPAITRCDKKIAIFLFRGLYKTKRMHKLQEKPSALKKEQPAFQIMKIL